MKHSLKQSKKNIVIITLSLLFGINSFSFGQLTPSKLFATGMVLQRNIDIPIWGTAGPQDSIIITFNSITDTAFADINGKWKISFPAMTEGGPYIMDIVCKTETKHYTDVYIGDVWVCSGQSNMERKVIEADNGTVNIAAANSQTIRQLKIGKALSNDTSSTLSTASWTPATSTYVGDFSAVAYYFARDIQPFINNVPIGIINVSYGGSRIETWMSEEMLGYDEGDVTLAAGEPERQPTLAFNKMIYPIIGLPIKGFLWYQGESNADNMNDAKVYGDLFKTMITEWRNLWNMGDLPFIWIQLPNQGTAYSESTPQSWDTWPILRAAQSRALTLPNTAEVVTIDVGEVDIHPGDKESVGARLSLVIRKLVYGETIVSEGPRYKSHVLLPNGSVQIEFDNLGSGLMAKDTTNGGLSWFSIAGADSVLHKANAVISGNSVIVSHPTITTPTIIRYAWEYNPVGINFYNQDSLPACPFKIDVVNTGFAINHFTCSATNIERGSFITLDWKTSGNVITTLNGIPVDSLSAKLLMPMDTTTYTLKIVDNNNALHMDSIVITVNVMNPRPTIRIAPTMGNVSAPNEPVIINATAAAPGGGTVKQVEFYIDDILYSTVTTAPYQMTWTPTEIGNYNITGLVINNIDDSTYSTPLTMYINNLTKVRYEAELSNYTGDASVSGYSIASNRRLLRVQQTWTMEFDSVDVDTSGTYQMSIRYLLNFEGPKEQNLYINGTLIRAIRFEAPDNATLMDYGLPIHLNAGINTIEFRTSWGWMSFDYIDILGAKPLPNSILPVISTRNVSLQVLKDTNGATQINYSLPKAGNVKLELVDISGKTVATLVYGNQAKGSYSSTVKQQLQAGVYIAKLTVNKEVITTNCIIK